MVEAPSRNTRAAAPCAGARHAQHVEHVVHGNPAWMHMTRVSRPLPVRSSRKPWSGCTTTSSRTGIFTLHSQAGGAGGAGVRQR